MSPTRRLRFPRPLAPPGVVVLALVAGLSLAVGGCEKHPAGEPAEGYGHGSARPGSKGGDKHQYDGRGVRFSDSQGTDIRASHHEEGGEGGESGAHAAGSEHGAPEKGKEHAPGHE